MPATVKTDRLTAERAIQLLCFVCILSLSVQIQATSVLDMVGTLPVCNYE